MPHTVAHLYLLVFPARKVVKVGKAVDIVNRLTALKRWWGEPDFDASYYVTADVSMVFRLERALHCLLDAFDASESAGDGRTELFRLDALPVALQHLNLYIGSKEPESFQLMKGIPQPPKVLKHKPANEARAYRRFRERGDRALESLDCTLHKLRYLHRLIGFLMRWQHRIPYQWDVIEGKIIFRVQTPWRRVMDSSALRSAFSYDVAGFDGGFHGINLCTTSGSSGIVQFEINNHLLANKDRPPDLLQSLLTQALGWVDELPRRSSAAENGIPLLNISLDDFFKSSETGDHAENELARLE